MANEFKVLDWLRAVREAHARETDSLSVKDRIDRLEKETESWLKAFLPGKHIPESVPKEATEK